MNQEIELKLTVPAIEYLISGLNALNEKQGTTLQQSANIITLSNVLNTKLDNHKESAEEAIEPKSNEEVEGV